MIVDRTNLSTTSIEEVRALCSHHMLPIEDHELSQLAQLFGIYRAGLAELGELADRQPLRLPQPLPSPPATRARDRAEGGRPSAPPVDTASALDRAAQAAAAARDTAVPTNAFIRVAEAPDELSSGPLSGLTFAVKDNIRVAGEPTTCGSSFAGREPASADAAVVAALRGAGGAYVGKTNLGEFAIVQSSPHFGEVLNPWDLERGAGGSSGGAAASVASGQVDLALGTDSAGSVRIPASMCGVVGFRPSNGSLSLEGLEGPAWTVDGAGVLARSVIDVQRTMAVLDWAVLPRREGGRRRKVGILTDGSMGGVDPELDAVYRGALQRLEGSDLELSQVSLGGLDLAPLVAAVIAYVDVASHHREWIRTRSREYGAEARQLVRLGHLFSGVDYVCAQRARRALLERYNSLTQGLDAVIMPTLPMVAAPAGADPSVPGEDDEIGLFALIRFTALANVIAAPAISLPVGLTPTDGLPVGAQLMAAPYHDEDLLAIALVAERAFGFDAVPALRADISLSADRSG
jgi:aspartyl-tRNA(Asn)/glutamyl-tRNA(Gln) amidotransferase subunit A